MMCQVTSMSRTFSTSRIQREVIHAKGQAGSNQKSALVMSAVNTATPTSMPPACGSAPRALLGRAGPLHGDLHRRLRPRGPCVTGVERDERRAPRPQSGDPDLADPAHEVDQLPLALELDPDRPGRLLRVGATHDRLDPGLAGPAVGEL